MKNKRLSREILGLSAVTFVITVVLFVLLRMCSSVIAESVLAARGILLTEEQYFVLDGWVLNLSLLVSIVFFLLLFLFLLSERLSYIRDIITGIDALQSGRMDHQVPVEGNNELTRLAEAVNYLSATQRQVKQNERALAEEKERLIRTLSHDIRTPLTSIMSYSEFLSDHDDCTKEERQEYIALIQKKGQQIKELMDILLDGGKRNLEWFEDGRLLLQQLIAEFEESLEDTFQVSAEIVSPAAFSGSFDVQELRRVFDNLASNIQKYADRAHPIVLSVHAEQAQLAICQKNKKRISDEPTESYQMGLNSIRRIAHNYEGRVEIRQDESEYEIMITLSEF